MTETISAFMARERGPTQIDAIKRTAAELLGMVARVSLLGLRIDDGLNGATSTSAWVEPLAARPRPREGCRFLNRGARGTQPRSA